MSIVKKIAATLLVLMLVIAASAFVFVKLIERRIAAHAYAPHLEVHPRPAEDFHFSTLDGRPETLAASKGKVVIVNLWGTWCLPCIAEMPTFQRLYNHFRNDPRVSFLMISRLDSAAAVRAYARRNHLDLPFYRMDDEEIPGSMQFRQYPSTFLYAPDGTLVASHIGPATWDDPTVIAFIESLKRD